ncbi:MAG: MBG domain-containing protein, partial [Atopobiaceae bacterium]|nr:MBG domain-containing protein [Atopobiaceae bacterium]MDD3177313.1 MBG domain-containing protein [Atopobiaceae bacterium]MDD4381509.1 MBG domain-containing protein [Atopobiaceae bacterium]
GQTWSETAPTWTDVTSAQTVHVKATNPNYGDATADGTVTITPAALTVTTPDATKAYDGGALTAAGTLSGLVPGETATFSTTGTQTEAGSSTNTYALTWDGSAKASNYTVTETLGTLTVTAAPATPVVPGDTTPTTPTGTTPTTPVTPASTTPVAAVVTPIATALQNAYQAAIGEEPTPLSTPSTAEEESIDENGTPLATAAEPVCWVHWYIMLGMLVTLVYGLVVLFRRRRYTKGLKNREKRVLREDDDQQDKQGESAPTIPSGAEA